MHQKPTIGRVVHFLPPSGCVGPESKSEPYASMITQVNKDETVELVTFGPNSIYFQHNVKYSESPQNGFWSWPPKI